MSKLRVKKKSSSRLFPAWIRCRECRNRFEGTNWADVRQLATKVLILVGAIMVILWVGFGTDTPPLEAPVSAEPPSASSMTPHTESVLSPPTDVLIATAEAGDRDAQYHLGAAFYREYREQDSQASLDVGLVWLTKAAKQGHARAQFQLGEIYEKGRGVIQDYTAAVEWLQQAAMQGEAEAMFRLGRMYQTGRGVPKDFVEAYVWLNIAGSRGETRAELPREHVHRLILDKITEAQHRSRTLNREIPHQE